MGDIFGGKLTGGIFAVIGLIVSIIMVGILAGPFGGLVSYFSPAAEDAEGNRFTRAYVGVSGDAEPGRCQINTDTNRAGGSGLGLTGTAGAAPTLNPATGFVAANCDNAVGAVSSIYNEQGAVIGATDDAGVLDSITTGIVWKQPPRAFSQLNFLNRILATLLALVAAIGLIMKTKSAYDSFSKGGFGDLGKTVMVEVTTLVLAVVAVNLAPTTLNLLAGTAQTYTSGQYDFSFVGLILKIVFAIVPTMLLIGIMGLISGMQVQKAAISGVGSLAGRARGFAGGGRRRMGMMYGR